jgi:hypothetical protein
MTTGTGELLKGNVGVISTESVLASGNRPNGVPELMQQHPPVVANVSYQFPTVFQSNAMNFAVKVLPAVTGAPTTVMVFVLTEETRTIAI